MTHGTERTAIVIHRTKGPGSRGRQHCAAVPAAVKLAALAVVMAVCALLGGCTASRNGLGTHDNVCFRVYPEALAAVHDHARLVGERYLPPRALIVQMPGVAVPDALTDASRVATCLVAFTGHFMASEVRRGWAPRGRSGRIAIVVIRQRDLVVLSTVVLNRIPPHLVFARVFPKLR